MQQCAVNFFPTGSVRKQNFRKNLKNRIFLLIVYYYKRYVISGVATNLDWENVCLKIAGYAHNTAVVDH